MAKLGEDGGVEPTDASQGPLPARMRKPRKADQVAARLAAFVDAPPVVEGVQPLAHGYFKMQRLRTAEQL